MREIAHVLGEERFEWMFGGISRYNFAPPPLPRQRSVLRYRYITFEFVTPTPPS